MLSWNNAIYCISCNTDLNTEGGEMPSKLEQLFKSKPYILIQIWSVNMAIHLLKGENSVSITEYFQYASFH